MIISKRKEEEHIPISARKCLLFIVVIAIIIRLLGMLIFQHWDFKDNKRFGFRDGEIGSALAAGQGFSWPYNSPYNPGKPPEPTAWQPPVYPLIIAAAFKAFGIYSTSSKVVLMMIQIIISALICVLIFLIGRRVFNVWVGLLAALMIALYPTALHLTIQKICSSNIFLLLLLLFIFQFFKLAEAPTIKKSILAGLTFGIAILTDPVVVAFFPFALGWLLFRERAELKTRIISAALVFLAVCTIISPWQIRNYLVFDRFFLIKSNFSRELFMGNYGSNASLTSERQYMATLDEGERSKLYQKKALDSILNNPEQLIRQICNRFFRYWTVLPVHNYRGANTNGIKEQIAGISYLIIIALGIVGLCLSSLRSREVQLLVVAILSLPVPYYLTWFTHFRYRFPVEPILIIFASFAMYQFWKLLKGNRSGSSR